MIYSLYALCFYAMLSPVITRGELSINTNTNTSKIINSSSTKLTSGIRISQSSDDAAGKEITEMIQQKQKVMQNYIPEQTKEEILEKAKDISLKQKRNMINDVDKEQIEQEQKEQKLRQQSLQAAGEELLKTQCSLQNPLQILRQ